MTDLRTRIAAVLLPHCDMGRQCMCGESWSTCDDFDEFDLHLADVLIRELNLTEDGGVIFHE